MIDKTDQYNRFLGGWVGAFLGNVLGSYTEGKSPAQVEDSFPRGLQVLPAPTAPSGLARVLRETGEAISSRTFPRPPRKSDVGLLSPVLRAITPGLSSVPAGLSPDELDEFVLRSIGQDDPPFPAPSVLLALWYARVLRVVVTTDDDGLQEVDEYLFGPIDKIERPSPAFIRAKDDDQSYVWGEARLLLAEGVGTGLATLERFDFTDPVLDPYTLAAGVVAWATDVRDETFARSLAFLVSRGGDSSSLGMIGGAVLGARIGFDDLDPDLLEGLTGLDRLVEEGSRLFQAAQEYKSGE